LRTDDIKTCEGILRDYSEIRKSLEVRRLEILTACGDSEDVDGGSPVPREQRVLEDAECAELSSIVDAISGAVRDLPVDLQKAVILIYFVEMDWELAALELYCESRTVRRWCAKAIRQMRFRLLAQYGKVLEWRFRQAEAVLEEYKDVPIAHIT